jgi:signal peptidase II
LKPFYKYLLLALALVCTDQAIKFAVKLNMLGSFFQIYFIENEGAAFGLTISRLVSPLVTISDETGKLILTVFSIILVGFIFNYLRQVARLRGALPILVAMILGGALGNIIDRVFYGAWFGKGGLQLNQYTGGLLHGRVVDMFYFDLWRFQWPDWVPALGGSGTSTPIFNFADACISVGIVAILIFQKRLFGKPAEKADAHPATHEVETVLRVQQPPRPPIVEDPTPSASEANQP